MVIRKQCTFMCVMMDDKYYSVVMGVYVRNKSIYKRGKFGDILLG